MMEWELDQDEEENEEGEEGGGEWSFGGRTASIFLIDAAKEMFDELDGQDDEDEEKVTPFLCSVKVRRRLRKLLFIVFLLIFFLFS